VNHSSAGRWMRRALMGVLVASAGCGADDLELLVPVDVELHWDASFDALDDGLVAAVPIDLMVYRSESGVPVEGVGVELRVDAFGVTPLDGDALEVVDPELCDGCEAVVWDAYRDLYLALDPELTGSASLALETDEHGLARAYLFVDALGEDGEGFEAVSVFASVADMERAETFLVVPR
jgi:hypothetical protein